MRDIDVEFVDVDDYACECYKMHHMGASCKWFCTECTQDASHSKVRGECDMMANHTPEVDTHKDGCVFVTGKQVRRWTSILKEECKSLKVEVKELEKKKDAASQATLAFKVEQLERRKVFHAQRLAHDQDNEPTMITVYEVERRKNVEYPLMDRQFCKPEEECKHEWCVFGPDLTADV